MASYIMALTYRPKIEGVFAGTIRQTIRKIKISKKTGKKREYKVGDTITFHTWEGKPYRSRWGRRMKVEVTDVYHLIITEQSILSTVALRDHEAGELIYTYPHLIINDNLGFIEYPWNEKGIDNLASNDGIDPPTGQELKRVMKGESPNSPIKGKHDWEGEYQIIRW